MCSGVAAMSTWTLGGMMWLGQAAPRRDLSMSTLASTLAPYVSISFLASSESPLKMTCVGAAPFCTVLRPGWGRQSLLASPVRGLGKSTATQ